MGIIVNGHLYDYGNAEIRVVSELYSGITEITYAHKLDPGVLRGTSPMPLGFTRGTYEVTNASFTMYKEDHSRLVRHLSAENPGKGYMEGVFLVHVTYTPIGGLFNEPIIDVLEGCRIKSDEDSHSSGNDALVVKCELNVYKLTRNGFSAVGGQGLGTQLNPGIPGPIPFGTP